ncbi:MAG: DUF885 domain-containing protein [Phycisphaerales bacterium]|nr:DUF885 domain-containing protein [Phycisphaerales bacterium]
MKAQLVRFALRSVTLLTVSLMTLTARADVAASLHALFDEHLAWQKREFPELAMEKGDYSNADRIADQSLAAIERRLQETAAFLERLRKHDRAALSADDQLNFDLFELELSQEVEGGRFRRFLAPVGGRFGPQQRIPQMAERVRFSTLRDYENYLSRLEQTPRAVADVIELLATGVREKRTAPRVALAGLEAQFERLTADGGLAALGQPFERMPASIAAEDRELLRKRFEEKSLPAVRAALAQLGRHVVSEYIPHCRESIAAHDWPDGPAMYAHALREMTTTDMTAAEIFELGQREVARIRAEMMQVIRRSDFLERKPEAGGLADEALFAAFLDYLRSDPRFYHADEESLLREYRDICKRVDAELPRLFGILPRQPYGVKKIPDFMAPTQTTAYYQPGDLRNAQAGVFFANTFRLDQRPRYEMIPLALHEAVPGHHLQIAIARELEGLPEFRRDAWHTAYGEGWALYAERLGIEMGFYGDPYDDFGRLLYEMWRACRLVVDPGMHAHGWTRERAVRFMLENTALSELNIHAEVDRYIAWPAQATAYKIGEIRIRALRERAERELGERFDMRVFHDVLLSSGSIPLSILERRVEDWIRKVAQGGAAAIGRAAGGTDNLTSADPGSNERPDVGRPGGGACCP